MVFDGTSGTVWKFIEILYLRNSGITWEQLKEEMIGKYASGRTTIKAIRKLFRIRQAEGETYAELSERVAVLATR